MHRLAAIALAGSLALAAAGCGGGSGDGHALPAPLVKQLTAVARSSARSFFGDPSPQTAEVYGPASYEAIEASDPASPGRSALPGDFYLIVLRGHFVCNCPVPPGGAPPRGTVATVVWSPTKQRGVTDYGLARRPPRPAARLGKPTVISLR